MLTVFNNTIFSWYLTESGYWNIWCKSFKSLNTAVSPTTPLPSAADHTTSVTRSGVSITQLDPQKRSYYKQQQKGLYAHINAHITHTWQHTHTHTCTHTHTLSLPLCVTNEGVSSNLVWADGPKKGWAVTRLSGLMPHLSSSVISSPGNIISDSSSCKHNRHQTQLSDTPSHLPVAHASVRTV